MTHQNTRRRLALLCGMALMLGAACRGDGTGTREYTLLECGSGSGTAASVAIGSEGGTVTAGGNALIVPPGAVSGRVTFRITERADRYVGVEVEPHGTQFAQNATLVLSYGGRCGNPAGSRNLQILEVASGTTRIIRALPVTVDSVTRTVRTTRLNHLSGYLIGSNRSAGE